MAKVKPAYEVVEDFGKMSIQIVEKYPEIFHGVDVNEIRCVKIINKERSSTSQTSLWKLSAVKMPMRLDCPYGWYVTLYSSDWDAMDEKHQLLLVAEVLNGIPTDADSEGKVNGFDSKGYKIMQRTFKTIDYLEEPNVPHILDEDVNWIQK